MTLIVLNEVVKEIPKEKYNNIIKGTYNRKILKIINNLYI
jgi:hypothetical protein